MDDGGRTEIMVVGSSMVDLISYLERVPAPGETIFGRSFSMGFGGKGANQAVMAALLGAQVSMVNCLATDVFGDLTVENFEKFGIDVNCVDQIEGNYSGVADIWVEPDGQNRIVLGAGANEALPSPRVVLCQFEVPQPAIIRAFERGRETGAITVLNPGPGAPLTPIVARMAKDMGTNVVVTLGERGALLCVAGSDSGTREMPAPPAEAVDTTGAGDAFVGAFAYAVARATASGTDAVGAARRAVEFACGVAASSVTRPGTQNSFPRDEELERYRRMLASSNDPGDSNSDLQKHTPPEEAG